MPSSASNRPTGRRPLLKAAVGSAAALGAVGASVRLTSSSNLDADGPLLRLAADRGDVESLEIVLGHDLMPQRRHTGHDGRSTWRTAHLPTTKHSMVAFTWTDATLEPHLHIRSRRGGTWQPWQHVSHLHDLPDVDSGEGNGLSGTELVWIGPSDGIQVRVGHQRPKDLTLVLLHPRPHSHDARAAASESAEDELGARTTTGSRPVPVPPLLSRKQWGADESWRTSAPRYNTTLQQVHVHHTASVNNYSRAEVPAMIRGMYHYHVFTMGWSDIGYNFLVDKYGRAWVGRAGGPGKLVRGAHTLGFNATSAGISTIGNFDLVQPPEAAVNAIVALAAWKLDSFGRNPLGTTSVRSEGSDKFRTGRVVTLPVIDGHRDTNDTACPGQHLYEQLPTIRRRTNALMAKYHTPAPSSVKVIKAPRVSGTPELGDTLTATHGYYSPAAPKVTYQWRRNGIPIAGATSAGYTVVAADLGKWLTAVVTATAPGLTPVVTTLKQPRVATTPTVTTIRSVGRKGRCAVHVAVTAPHGGVVPSGPVTIVVNDRSHSVPLSSKGKATWHFVGFTTTGAKPVRASFPGGSGFEASQATGTVTIS